MRKINKPNIKSLILFIVIGLLYPFIKYSTSETGKMLKFLDSMTIIGFVYLIVGIITSIYYHGDLDAIVFRMKYPKISDNTSYETYKKDKEKERENSFNYPLFVGIFFIILSYILATFCY